MPRSSKRLSTVRGIGRWTAEMFLLFHLGRLDVWPVDDYGVRKGFAVLHALTEPPLPRALPSATFPGTIDVVCSIAQIFSPEEGEHNPMDRLAT